MRSPMASFELVVGDQQRGGAGLLQNAAHLVGQTFAQIHVEVGKRFVQQEQAWFGRQRTRQRHTLLLAA